MKIILISLYGIESIGVRILFSFLKAYGFDVTIIFLKKWVNNNICVPSIVEEACLVKLLKNISPALVGLSFGTSYFNIAKKITFSIKSNLDSMVVWGGVHATI
ncbi:MAG: cobalamin-dependent protein, partial [Candidatus Omnitrophica bacterium]|nr:cobalamin-dependent protein [Candidatus Omnitrophota bacterium]